MLQYVNTVLVGKMPATYTTVDALNVGEIAMFDENGKILIDADGVKAAKEVAFGLVDSKMTVTLPNGTLATRNAITFSKNIDKSLVKTPDLTVTPYKAPVQDSYTISFATVATTEETRYVVKFLYRDLSEYKFQVTKSYEFLAQSGATPAQIVTALIKQINSDKSRRIDATVVAGGTSFTVTAKVTDDNEGINSINDYSQVNMEVAVYATNPRRGYLYSRPFVPTGSTVTKVTTADPGDGNPKIIRDREKAALSYKGITNRTSFPVNKPELKVDLSKTYGSLVIEWQSLYRTPDNQYIKNTPLSVEVYGEAATLQVHQDMISAIKA